MPLLEEIDEGSEAGRSPAEKLKTEHRRKRAKGRKKKPVKVGRSIFKNAAVRFATCSLQYHFGLKVTVGALNVLVSPTKFWGISCWHSG